MKRIDALRPLFLKISLITSLTLVVLLFNFTIVRPHQKPLVATTMDTNAVEVIRTIHPKREKKVPPPVSLKVAPVEIDSVAFTEVDSLVSTEPDPLAEDAGTDTVATSPAQVEVAPAPEVVAPPTREEPLLIADKMPFFGDCRSQDQIEQKACSDNALMTYISGHLKYPALARENNVQGLVVIEFVVQKDGAISDIRILRDIGMGCGAASIDVVQSMPRWSPGVNRGRPVPVLFRLPVRFRLQ